MSVDGAWMPKHVGTTMKRILQPGTEVKPGSSGFFGYFTDPIATYVIVDGVPTLHVKQGFVEPELQSVHEGRIRKLDARRGA